MYKHLLLACSLLSYAASAAEQTIPESIIKDLISSVLKQSYPYLEAGTLTISLTEYDASSLTGELAVLQASEIITQPCALTTATDSYDAIIEYQIITLKDGIIPLLPVHPIYAGTIHINEHVFPFHVSTSALQVKEAPHATPLTPAEMEEAAGAIKYLAGRPEFDASVAGAAMAQFCLNKYRETKNINFLIMSKKF